MKSVSAVVLVQILALHCLAGPLSKGIKIVRPGDYPQSVQEGLKKQAFVNRKADLEMQKLYEQASADLKFRTHMGNVDEKWREASDSLELISVLETKDQGKSGVIQSLIHHSPGSSTKETMKVPEASFPVEHAVITGKGANRPHYSLVRQGHTEKGKAMSESLEFTTFDSGDKKFRETLKVKLVNEDEVTTALIARGQSSRQLELKINLAVKKGDEEKIYESYALPIPRDEKPLHFKAGPKKATIYLQRPSGEVVESVYDLKYGSKLAEKNRKNRTLSASEVERLGLIVDFKNAAAENAVTSGSATRGMTVEASK